MADKNFKTLTDKDGKRYKFNAEAFKEIYARKQKQYKAQGKTEQSLRSDLGKNLGVSPDAIKGWKYGYNGPGDLSLIRKSADFLGTDYLNMVQEAGQEDDMDSNTNAAEKNTEAEVVNITRNNESMDTEKEAMSGLYQAAVDAIDNLAFYATMSMEMEWENGAYNAGWSLERSKNKNDEKIDENSADDSNNTTENEDILFVYDSIKECSEEFTKAYDEILSYGVKAPINLVREVSNLIEQLYSEIMFRKSIFSKENITDYIFEEVYEHHDYEDFPGNEHELCMLAYKRECTNRLFDIFEEAAGENKPKDTQTEEVKE